jgi:hypothetical protein
VADQTVYVYARGEPLAYFSVTDPNTTRTSAEAAAKRFAIDKGIAPDDITFVWRNERTSGVPDDTAALTTEMRRRNRAKT